ncbi:hypothetical protein F5Y15DRAFT_76653 [Xylariaceae sp. FL0016]|nr:hypothetical protein F5Y15DRAFT_76653 [Xylariaceae sp. FL0016]
MLYGCTLLASDKIKELTFGASGGRTSTRRACYFTIDFLTPIRKIAAQEKIHFDHREDSSSKCSSTMYSPTPPPPIPPPKPSSQDVSRLGTPSATSSPRPPPPVPGSENEYNNVGVEGKGKTPADVSGLIPAQPGMGSAQAQTQPIPDPGEGWLPKVLEDKSKQDLAHILSTPSLLHALTVSPTTAHPSTAQSQTTLQAALQANIELASHLTEHETQLAGLRATTQAQLLSAHALERQWRAKQGEMDGALGPFAPGSLYARLNQSLSEQEMVCTALEESFLDGGGEEGRASEREVLDWVRRYRESRKVFYLRQERKERWNERRVGGWR